MYLCSKMKTVQRVGSLIRFSMQDIFLSNLTFLATCPICEILHIWRLSWHCRQQLAFMRCFPPCYKRHQRLSHTCLILGGQLQKFDWSWFAVKTCRNHAWSWKRIKQLGKQFCRENLRIKIIDFGSAVEEDGALTRSLISNIISHV